MKYLKKEKFFKLGRRILNVLNMEYWKEYWILKIE